MKDAELSDGSRPLSVGRGCLACGGDAWLPLPAPAAGRSMLSDGSVLAVTLRKCTCSKCGLVQHLEPPDDNAIRSYFGSSYALGDCEPNMGFEGQRQRQYAEWISRSLGAFSPHSLLELGCGNGALLRELIARFPSANVAGLESSERAVRRGQQSGLPVHAAYVTGQDSLEGYSADLVLSVNVLEHTPRPAGFLDAAKRAAKDAGAVLIICPNGLEVGSELLIFDHLFSFCPSNLFVLLRGAGLTPIRHECSPRELPGFQLVLAAARTTEARDRQGPIPDTPAEVPGLHAARVSYLNRWRHLDDRLRESIEPYRSRVMFGIGEMALLIRAYAPEAWERVTAFVVDDPAAGAFCGRPVHSFRELKPAEDQVVLLAVSPRSREIVSSRLKAAGHRVLCLDDLGRS